MNQENNTSPLLSEVSVTTMDFPTAIRHVIEGKEVTKLEWGNPDIYGVLANGILMLHKEDSKMYQWVLNEGDLFGHDWVIRSSVN